jgi:3-oxoadipate CoA-transferase beta subunit
MNTDTMKRVGLTRGQMAWRAAQDIGDGAYVNLGIGIPEQVANYIPDGRTVIYHTENGIMGFGVAPPSGEEDPELINAGKKPITLEPGASFFHQADSFAMIRGGHLDMCFLGALQVAQNGDLANWSTGTRSAVPAVGGAMDLVAGVKRVHVLTEHTTRDGAPKLVETCTYPLTAKTVVKRIYTNLAVVDAGDDGFVVQELAPGVTRKAVAEMTGASLKFSDDLKKITAPKFG